jgi:hypothetical protein
VWDANDHSRGVWNVCRADRQRNGAVQNKMAENIKTGGGSAVKWRKTWRVPQNRKWQQHEAV